MREPPERLMMRDRHPGPYFPPDENLFRRFSPDLWDGQELELDAVDLPDISCIRGKYGRAEDALFSSSGHFDGWGVCSFQVQDIPPEMLDRGVFRYTFQPHHVPDRRNYPHSEVRAFE